MAADPSVASLTGDPVVEEARKRWNRCSEWESASRSRFIDDLKFRHGDSDNGYQWPNAIRRARDVDARPCLTMNIIRQHNLQISNEAKKNKSSVKFMALGNGATQESANVMKEIMRGIEYHSRAQSAYSLARAFQIDGGIGWWRLVTDYVSNETVDEQDIYIRPVNDPLSVYMDPDCQEKDCSDGKFAFVFDNLTVEDFEEAYPKYKGLESLAPLGMGGLEDDLVRKEEVRVCEYFRKVEKRDQLVSFVHMNQRHTIRKSKLHEKMHGILDDPQSKIRTIYDEVIEWKLIAGEKVIDETIWPGKYIPLIRCIGEETVIEGILDRKGHTRAMKDAQRMYNYNASSQVEFVALQGKTPWIAAAAAIEDFESMWNSANIVNHSVLPVNHVDDAGNPIPPPQRQEPPNASPAYQAGMETAFNQMMMTSGQFQNQMGMMGNERTGAAIGKRQEQSDTAVFHFQDNYEEALIYTGRQIIDLVPKIYDTKRVKKLLADDGTDMEVEIDPTARQAYFEQIAHDGEIAKRIFNPLLGKYDIASSVGPAYGSKRQETVEALTLILTQNPGLTAVVGDLLLSSMDFDKAQEAAQRLKRMVPPQALGKGPTAEEQKLQAQVQSLSVALAKSMERQGKVQIKLDGKDEMRDIDVYKAETNRMKALQDALPADKQGLQELIQQLVKDSLETNLGGLSSANAGDIGDQAGDDTNPLPSEEGPPMPGARKAPDGEWYMLDPTRQGKYLHIGSLVQQRQPQGQGPSLGG